MRAAFASIADPDQPLRALTVGERPSPELPDDDWVTVDVRAAALNQHDLWSLRGVGLRGDRLPMILGCDGAGVDPDGNEVVIYPVVDDPDDPRGISLLSEHHQGTLAERVAVPRGSLVAKPAAMTFTEAACLPTAWLTAFHMLTERGRIDLADAVLVQGAGGGVATAAVELAVAFGKRVYATSRDPLKRERIAALGATAVEPGARLPERVGLVIDSVGAPTMDHSMKCSAPGARIVVCGATGGHLATVDLRRLFAMRLDLLGSTMGSRDDLVALMSFMAANEVHPVIDSTFAFDDVASAFARLDSGEIFGKVTVEL